MRASLGYLGSALEAAKRNCCIAHNQFGVLQAEANVAYRNLQGAIVWM